MNLEEMIYADAARSPRGNRCIIFLGDIIDRGPKSAQVIEHLQLPPKNGFTRYVLAGNHEVDFLKFLEEPQQGSRWLAIGGADTLRSYGVTGIPGANSPAQLRRLAMFARSAVPAPHLDFLRSLPLTIAWRNFMFVHAGLRPGVAWANQSDLDLLSIRDEFLDATPTWPEVVVHGHSPVRWATRYEARIALDTACYATGRLSAVRIDDASIRFLSFPQIGPHGDSGSAPLQIGAIDPLMVGI